MWAYSNIICNHFQKFQKFKDSNLFWWPKSMALKGTSRGLGRMFLLFEMNPLVASCNMADKSRRFCVYET